jgi:hypothetical protein
MRRPLLLIGLAGALLASAPACGLPEGDPSTPAGAHYRWLAAAARGDGEELWELLDPAVRADYEKWLVSERLAIAEIRAAYPKDDVAPALAAFDGGRRGDLPDAQRLFEATRRPEGAPPLEGLATLGARVRSEEPSADGRTVTLRTWGGDEVTVVAGEGGQWHLTLPPAEVERLRSAREAAERNLARVRKNLKKLSGKGG